MLIFYEKLRIKTAILHLFCQNQDLHLQTLNKRQALSFSLQKVKFVSLLKTQPKRKKITSIL
jgi:hypothetical protein